MDQKKKEYTGPILDYRCSNVCNTCQMSIRCNKVPRLALAHGLWLGNVPEELSSLRFVEKLLIARVRHTCCFLKISTGGHKMKANAIAFKTPIPKVYDKLLLEMKWMRYLQFFLWVHANQHWKIIIDHWFLCDETM